MIDDLIFLIGIIFLVVSVLIISATAIFIALTTPIVRGKHERKDSTNGSLPDSDCGSGGDSRRDSESYSRR